MRFLQTMCLLAAWWPLLVSTQANAADALLQLEYPGFTVWLDCAERSAVMFRYRAEADTGDLPRHSRFSLDPAVPAECQQTSTNSYGAGPEPYDRGHLVPANHLDHLADGIRDSNLMTNVLPQASRMNRGAWLRTEEIIECWRDIEPLDVWGGVIIGFDPHDDAFVETHGVRTPDYFWKVVIAAGRHLAWIIPNRAEAATDQLDRYLVTVGQIERAAGVSIPLPPLGKRILARSSWPLPDDCDRS